MEEKERYEIHIYDDVCVDLFNNGVLDKSINNTYKLEDLLNQQDKRIKELEQENQQLKQQLHDLPKKIVGEIRKEIEFPLYVHPDFDEFECLFDIDKLLDTILKKYGEKDESK